MNVIQVKHFGDFTEKAYTFRLPDGVVVEEGAILLVDTNMHGPQLAKAITHSADITDQNILKMVAGGKRVRSKVIGIYQLLNLTFD